MISDSAQDDLDRRDARAGELAAAVLVAGLARLHQQQRLRRPLQLAARREGRVERLRRGAEDVEAAVVAGPRSTAPAPSRPAFPPSPGPLTSRPSLSSSGRKSYTLYF